MTARIEDRLENRILRGHARTVRLVAAVDAMLAAARTGPHRDDLLDVRNGLSRIAATLDGEA